MKALFFILALGMFTSVYAEVGETTTDCPAMNQNKDKKVSEIKKQEKKRQSTIRQ